MRKGKKIFVVCYLISFLLIIVGMFFLIFKGKISKPTREEFENVVKEAGCKLNYDYDKEYKFMDNYILADEECAMFASRRTSRRRVRTQLPRRQTRLPLKQF